MIIQPIKTRVYQEGEDLTKFIVNYLPALKDRSVVVVTSKIVALAERRTVPNLGGNFREKLIKSESQWALRTKHTWLTIKDDTVMSSAGIDESNAKGRIVLLPTDSWQSAKLIRQVLMKKYGIRKLGVIITDSRLLPLRAGIVGMALGYAGFKGIRDYRGKKDIFGRKLKLSRTDVADSLATAAVLCMGEGAERQPLALIQQPPVEFCNFVNRKELIIKIKEDIYAPLFRQYLK